MTRPQDDLDVLIRSERQAPPVPPQEVADRGWLRLRGELGAVAVLPQIDVPPGLVESVVVGKAGAATIATTVMGWSWVGKIVASAVVTVAVGGIGVAASGIGRVESSSVPAVVATPAATRAAAEIIAPTEAPLPAELPSVAAPVELMPAAVMPQITPAEVERSRPPAPRRAGTPRTGIDPEPPLISAALRALSKNDPKEALRVLDQHRKQFPAGALTEEREHLRISALCKAGRAAEAATLRTKFLQRWPSSTYASQVRGACSTD